MEVASAANERAIDEATTLDFPPCLGLPSLAGTRCRHLLSFHGVGCGEFTVPMGLGAQCTCMQFTTFSDGCTTSRTRHG
jgi:hypothetical protein